MPAIDKLSFERDLLNKQQYPVAGIDEAGRGPLAGPVVASAVILPEDWIRTGLPKGLNGLNDSKQLTPGKREEFFGYLMESEKIHYSIVEVDSEKIDEWNILRATHHAMNQCLLELTIHPRHALVDGLRVPSLTVNQTPLVKGDSRSFSIAAASVLAKVKRDRIMRDFDEMYPQYGFAQHKGYGTAKHLEAIRKHGPCPIHRMTFAPIRRSLEQQELFPHPSPH
ncbi:MAG TPA: ribonuclease HII [Verrucomicrobiales bacterium]|nr:ribonuclease HII [Verrucomicrobiales bacterium]HIL72409.1 ribonuclease HII [Verrucomicrobiota bacterium]